MDFRKIFDSRVDPKDFDKRRFRYCDELYNDMKAYCGGLDAKKSVLEIGPGTGQATEPVLKTGCSYLAIELGEHFAQEMESKFCSYPNFQIVNDDFETFGFGENRFDLVYSAATIQWIPEKIAFPKCHQILKPGGALAMFMTRTDYQTPNPELYEKIQRVYDAYFKPEIPYTQHFEYENATHYGFTDFTRHEYPQTVVMTADQYISHIQIHADHLTLREPERSQFFTGVKEAIQSFGGTITLYNTTVLYLTRKL